MGQNEKMKGKDYIACGILSLMNMVGMLVAAVMNISGYGYFWGRTDVYARRGKNGGYFPRCSAWWDNPACPKKVDKKKFCDEDCPYKTRVAALRRGYPLFALVGTAFVMYS